MAAEALRGRVPLDYYYSFLAEQFNPPNSKPSLDIYEILFGLKPPIIITTNYDKLIENAYAQLHRKALTVKTYADAAGVQRRMQDSSGATKPFLFKIHGDIEDAGSIIFTETDYRKLLYDELGYKSVISSIFIHYTVVFLGFSFKDKEISLLLEQQRHFLKSEANPDYIIVPEGDLTSVEHERLRADYGLDVLYYKPAPNHRALKTLLSAIQRKVKQQRGHR